jgi:hypothetical protein
LPTGGIDPPLNQYGLQRIADEEPVPQVSVTAHTDSIDLYAALETKRMQGAASS